MKFVKYLKCKKILNTRTACKSEDDCDHKAFKGISVVCLPPDLHIYLHLCPFYLLISF